MSELKIEFPNEKIKQEFATWLSESGEQSFFEWLEILGIDADLRFGFHGPENKEYAQNDKRRYGKFLCDNTIRVEIV